MLIDNTNLFIQFPTTIASINNISIVEKINEHGTCRLEISLIEKEKFGVISSLNIGTTVKVVYKEDNNIKVLFSGCPIHVQLKQVREIQIALITLSTTSIKLDIKKKRRSFQYKDNPFKTLFENIIINDNGGDFLDKGSKGKVQEYPFIQYDETDWEFLKRMGARLKQVIVVDATKDKPSLFLGVPEKKSYIHNKSNHEKSKDLNLHRIYLSNFGDWKEEDNTFVCFESTLDYEICDNIIFNDISFHIVEKHAKLVEGVIVFKYFLKKKVSIKTNLTYNKNNIGLSISGKVIDLRNDQIKVHLEIDKEQPIDKAYWYTYDTFYTTEGETGLYCMPQIGDDINLYIPNYFEEDAFLRNINRLDVKKNPKVQDPEIKYMGTIDKKEMKLSKDQFKFTCLASGIYINMEDSTGIEFKSPEKIEINSDKDIAIYGDKISLKAKDEILICTSGSNIILEKTLHLKGDGGVSV